MVGKAFATSSAACLLALPALATSLAAPKCLYRPAEVLWFSVSDSNVVAVFGSGQAGVWDYPSGTTRGQFGLPVNSDLYPGDNLAAVRSGSLMLAVANDGPIWVGDKSFSMANVYDAATHKTTLIKAELEAPTSCGFVGTTLFFAAKPPNNAVVVAVDSVAGTTLWRSETDDDVQTGTIVLARGHCYVNFCRDGHLRARNQSGRLVWDWTVPKGRFAEPGCWPQNPALPYVVVHQSAVDKEDSADLVALSAKDGSTVWRKNGVRFGSLKAVSDDGKWQVFYQEGRVVVSALPDLKKSQELPLTDDLDAAFSPDGRFLFCLPALVKEAEDKSKNTFTVSRRSRVLSVVEVETGRIVKQIPLNIAASKR